MRLQSVRARLTLWNVGVLALVLVLLGFLLRFTLQQTLLSGVDARLQRMAQPVERQVSLNGLRRGPDDSLPPPYGGQSNPPGPPPSNDQFDSGGGPDGGNPPPGQGPPNDFDGQGPSNDQGAGPNDGPGGPNPGPGYDAQGNAAADQNSPNDAGEPPQPPPPGPGNGRRPPRPRPRRPLPGEYPPRLLNPDGHPVGASPGDPSGAYDRSLFNLSLAGSDRYGETMYNGVVLRVYSAPVYHKGRLTAVVQVEQPLTDVIVGVDRLTRTLLLVSPLALLIAGLSGGLLASRALRPVRQLIVTAEGIEAHDLAGRIPVIGSDEFAELSTTINGMFARLESSFERQNEAIRQLRRFTADASHELRTPLTVIKANTSLALTGPDDIESYRVAMQEADWAADRMNAIVQDLLLLARSDDGSLAMTLNTVAVSDLVEQAVRLVARPDAAAIEVRPIPPNLKVLADREAIERLLGNLLKNAQRHTPPSGHIIVVAEAKDSNTRITVADTGEGIAAQHLPHVFERFYRIDSARTRERGGTGLGLPICRTIAEAHGGTIEIASTVGIGTQVKVTLPSVASATGQPLPQPSS